MKTSLALLLVTLVAVLSSDWIIQGTEALKCCVGVQCEGKDCVDQHTIYFTCNTNDGCKEGDHCLGVSFKAKAGSGHEVSGYGASCVEKKPGNGNCDGFKNNYQNKLYPKIPLDLKCMECEDREYCNTISEIKSSATGRFEPLMMVMTMAAATLLVVFLIRM